MKSKKILIYRFYNKTLNFKGFLLFFNKMILEWKNNL